MQRQQQLTEWLHSLFPNRSFTLAPASADASFRRYFRVAFTDGGTLIVMDAPPQHEDCRPFLHIGKLFEDAGTHVPHVFAQDLQQGFLLLSDLGNTTYLQALNADTAPALYGAATDALIKIQLASRDNELPPYDEALLLREMRLFPEWYIAKHLNVTLSDTQQAKLETVFARIVANNLAQPRVYVHRDYHSRNLMVVDPTRWGEAPRCGRVDQAATSANGLLPEERVV
ncbi:MAG: phosphotransferase, partial [Methylobacter sp.]|uniref:aminoglycoside phosphotransferase family protein n=1 Tax=Methylobacter sp. TaxID=2051955 RepID=UPI0025ECDDCF